METAPIWRGAYVCATILISAVASFALEPCNPNASQTAHNVLDDLDLIGTSNAVLSGQHIYDGPVSNSSLRVLHAESGEWAAVLGADFFGTYLDANSRRRRMAAITEYGSSGGLVTICWHETSPLNGALIPATFPTACRRS